MTTRTRLYAVMASGALALAIGSAASAQYFQNLTGTEHHETPRGIAVAGDDLVTTGFRVIDQQIVAYASRHRSDGALLWAWDYPEAGPSTGWSALESVSGDLIVAGSTTSAGPGLRLSVMRLSPLGAVIWAGLYESTGFEVADVASGVRRNVAVEEVSDIGYGVVTSEDRPGFPGLTQAQMMLIGQNGVPFFQKSYITSISAMPVGVSFNDLRIDTASPNLGIVVTGTVQFDPLPGMGGSPSYEALYARFDLSGNPIAAYSYRLRREPDSPPADTYGDGIEVVPGGDVVIMGRTGFYADGDGSAAVLRITPGGAVVWARAASGIAPAAAAMSRSEQRVLATAGEARHAAGEPGNIGLLGVDELGNHVFSRAYTEASPASESIGRDQVWVDADRPGWAVVGDETEPHSFGGRDIALVRTDDGARVGCEERDVAAAFETPIVEIRQLELLQSARFASTFRGIVPVDPAFREEVVCASDCACPGDANGDGVIDFNDINAVLGAWGAVYAPGTGLGDANCDGVVDFNDINAVLAAWGTTCP